MKNTIAEQNVTFMKSAVTLSTDTIDVFFDENGFQPLQYAARLGDVLRFRNTSKTTTSSLTIYVLNQEDSTLSESLLGPSNAQVQVGKLPVNKVVQSEGSFLLSLVPPSLLLHGTSTTDYSGQKLAPILISN